MKLDAENQRIVEVDKRGDKLLKCKCRICGLSIYAEAHELPSLMLEHSTHHFTSTIVVNIRKSKYDIYIGRPRTWNGEVKTIGYGNPFSEKKYGREKCISLFREYFYNRIGEDPDFHEMILSLKGKRLGCFCKPKSCHGDIIKEYLDNIEENRTEGTLSQIEVSTEGKISTPAEGTSNRGQDPVEGKNKISICIIKRRAKSEGSYSIKKRGQNRFLYYNYYTGDGKRTSIYLGKVDTNLTTEMTLEQKQSQHKEYLAKKKAKEDKKKGIEQNGSK